MAAVTITERFVSVLGPRKMEVAQITIAADADTYTSLIQRPTFGYFVHNSDTNAVVESVNVSISGRTITFNNDAISASAGVLVLFGF